MVRCTWDRPAVQTDEQAPHPGAGPAQAAGYSAHMRVLKSTKSPKKTLQGFIADHVSPNVDHIYTDEHPGYIGLDADSGEVGIHQSVNHSAKEYVRGIVHTNSIESAFGLFKRGVVGSFHQVSAKHLDRYLDEFEFRFNNRKNKYLFRDTLVRLMEGKALTYDKLTA